MTGMFCKRIAMAVVAGFGLALALPADAANPPVIERLSKEPTTLFDSGMKRLRLFAEKLAGTDHPGLVQGGYRHDRNPLRLSHPH
jgi:hypothetical protein